jgi:hypothetical protein
MIENDRAIPLEQPIESASVHESDPDAAEPVLVTSDAGSEEFPPSYLGNRLVLSVTVGR